MAEKISEAKGTSRSLITGIVTGLFMMLISYLMDGYGLMDAGDAYISRPLWVYVLCMCIAMSALIVSQVVFSQKRYWQNQRFSDMPIAITAQK